MWPFPIPRGYVAGVVRREGIDCLGKGFGRSLCLGAIGLRWLGEAGALASEWNEF